MLCCVEQVIEFLEEGACPFCCSHRLLVKLDEFLTHRLHCLTAGDCIEHLRLEELDEEVCRRIGASAERGVQDALLIVQAFDSARRCITRLPYWRVRIEGGPVR